jgi:hypothetical protein
MHSIGVKPRRAKTLAGAVAFERTVYECQSCRASAAPLDAEIGLERGENMSRALVRKVAWSGAHHAFADASADVREMIGIEVSPAECHRVALEIGARMNRAQREDDERRLAPASRECPAPAPQIQTERLVIEADAAAVLTRKGEEHKMVWCGRAFGLEDRGSKGKAGSTERPFIVNGRHTASAADMDDFGGRLKALGYRMGLRSARDVAFVADGASCLWRWAEENLPPGTTLIQDFWHVFEHLSGLARDLWGEGSEQTERQREKWKEALRESRLDEIIDDLDAEYKKRRGAKRTRLKKEMHYLKSGRARMDYAKFREQGWPIGSGAIEADCKHLVKERFCLTGARWRRTNIEPVLALRLAIFNEQWESAWSRN